MRQWHRWAAIPAAVFLFVIALTGVLLHLDMIRVGQSPPGHGEAPPRGEHPLPNDATLAAMVARLTQAVHRHPDIKVTTLRIDLAGPDITLSAGGDGPPGSPTVQVNARTGAEIPFHRAPRDFHYILQDIHAGYIAGWPGRIISILSGIALIVLSVTGLQIWWDMRRRRKKKALWW